MGQICHCLHVLGYNVKKCTSPSVSKIPWVTSYLTPSSLFQDQFQNHCTRVTTFITLNITSSTHAIFCTKTEFFDNSTQWMVNLFLVTYLPCETLTVGSEVCFINYLTECYCKSTLHVCSIMVIAIPIFFSTLHNVHTVVLAETMCTYGKVEHWNFCLWWNVAWFV